MEIYIENARLNQLADAIANIQSCPFTGRVTADQVKLALGEQGNIWPLSILADALGDFLPQRILLKSYRA